MAQGSVPGMPHAYMHILIWETLWFRHVKYENCFLSHVVFSLNFIPLKELQGTLLQKAFGSLPALRLFASLLKDTLTVKLLVDHSCYLRNNSVLSQMT